VSRRRTIAILALTSLLLITLDVQNNFITNGARRFFAFIFEPIQDSARVFTRPVENAWRSFSNYDALEAENKILQDRLDQQEGAFIAALAVVRDAQELLALNGIDNLANISSITAQVVGGTPSNFSQIVEINQGSDRGLRVGMPVVNAAGLVGKVTEVFPKRALVMLANDVRYAIPVQVVNVPESEPVAAPTTTTTIAPSTTTTTVAPEGITEEAISVTTVPGGVATIPTIVPTVPPTVAEPAAPVSPGTTSPSFKIDDLPVAETGAFRGRGPDRAPVVEFIDQNSRFGEIRVGALVITSGGAQSLAPRGIVIGRVIKITERTGTAGAILEVRMTSRLSVLNFVRILLYQPVAAN
jgi:rod shape-determining protein MreC